MSSAARFWSYDSRSHASSGAASNGLFVPLANARASGPSSDRLNGHRKSKRHETVRRTVAIREGSRDDKRRNLATVPESLPGATSLNDERSAPGRIHASAGPTTGPRAYARANTIGFTISVAAASSSPAGSAASTGGDLRRRSKLSIAVPDRLSFGSMSISHIYHFPGTPDFGHTKSGAYMCEAEAQPAGNRAAMNERHP
jgi:hypothetical protein